MDSDEICCYLDCTDKCNWFDLATNLLDHSQHEDPGVFGDRFVEEEDEIDDDVNGFPADLLSPTRRPGQPRPITNYFSIAKILQHKEVRSVPHPLCSFIIGRMALHLSYNPSIKNATIDEVAIMFGLPDLQPAIADFLHCEVTHGNHIHSIGGPRRALHDTELPFNNVQVWFKVQLQETNFHDPHNIDPLKRSIVHHLATPGLWVVIQTNSGHSWPASSLAGHSIGQIRLIIRPIGRSGTPWAWDDQFLTYIQCFDISSERDPTTQLHTLKRSKRLSGSQMGDVIPVSQLRVPVLLPLANQWYKLIRGKGPSSAVTFQEVLDLLETHLDLLPKDKPSPELLFVRKVIAALL
ncbi:hypothetical protein DEU56DRAFT_914584 [Suillus clintonianus]|uniref:uncharacterized protein n=1 Tax=Suillus clintonianus TaxID=1904413 RepID=UPI001B872B82|nr:uncharacterized protein DEU56DRAFT_914584 [Suillus clintonianus]KAG2131050.1 hypothetical protein DEU56DRAFT_914584 [Suillus clintonianus]